MVCFAQPTRSRPASRPSPYPMLLLPPDADAANEMIQALWESGIGLSAVVPATRENIAKELPWLTEPKQARDVENPADWELSVWTVFFVCGVFAGIALSAIAGL